MAEHVSPAAGFGVPVTAAAAALLLSLTVTTKAANSRTPH
jgi:hypothetical protein